jgi:hypothetical protein
VKSGRAFRCRECDAPSRVLETRGDGDTTVRVRRCSNGHKFVTREVFERDVESELPPRDGRGRWRALEAR